MKKLGLLGLLLLAGCGEDKQVYDFDIIARQEAGYVWRCTASHLEWLGRLGTFRCDKYEWRCGRTSAPCNAIKD